MSALDPVVVPAAAPRQTLTAEHWAEAALDVIASGGIEAVAVEPLARTLNVTKGSFYWHYTNRDALVARALEVWERHETVEMIGRAEQEPSPRERIHTFFRSAANTDARSERILLALSGSKHAAARACVQRVTEAWRAYIETCYRGLGMEPAAARNWATFAYSTFMGTVRMRRDNPDALPSGPQFNDYLRFLIRSLIPGTSAASAEPSAVVVPLRKTGT
jgi:AcrR family transcriptional regulator